MLCKKLVVTFAFQPLQPPAGALVCIPANLHFLRDVSSAASSSGACSSNHLDYCASSAPFASYRIMQSEIRHDQDQHLRRKNLHTRLSRRHASIVGGADGQSSDRPAETDALSFAVALYKFSRPHTMIGSAISILSISALALQGQVFNGVAVTALAQALTSALLMNISIVGTNQLFDIEIDRINKPDLPLASGALSVSEGTAIVAVSTAASLALGWASGSAPLMATLVVSMLLGILYSCELPFMRWKRSPLLAAGCILAVRAVIVQVGVQGCFGIRMHSTYAHACSS